MNRATGLCPGTFLTDIEVVIFSYNRGLLLRNCVESVRLLMPLSPITIFDDLSSDSTTNAIIDDISRNCFVRVIQPSRIHTDSKQASRKVGNLNHNMNLFISHYRRLRYILFLQDDMQLVRSFTPTDELNVAQLFKRYAKSAFLYPGFLAYRHEFESQTCEIGFLHDDDVYTFSPSYQYAGVWDVCLAYVDRLIASCFTFGNELESSRRALALFGPMLFLRYPFVAHLPAPPCCHGRHISLTQSAWEFLNCGLYPIDILPSDKVKALLENKQSLPFASDYLTSVNYRGEHPWPYSRLEGAPRILKIIDRCEQALSSTIRFLFSRLRCWLFSAL